MAAKLTEHEIDCIRETRKMIGTKRLFNVMDVWPLVKRAEYVFGRLEDKGLVTSTYHDGEKHWAFTPEADVIG